MTKRNLKRFLGKLWVGALALSFASLSPVVLAATPAAQNPQPANTSPDALRAQPKATSRIVPGAFFAQGRGKEKTIALSFDDGPGASTPEVLAILEKYNIKATFFVNGKNLKEHQTVLKTIHAAGHEIGDHTQNHVDFYAYEKKNDLAATQSYITREMAKSRQAIYDVLAEYPRLCRMPHGYHRKWLGQIAAKHDYTLVNWSFGTDWQKMTPEAMATQYEAHIRPGAILLFHDGGTKRQKMLGFLERVIKTAKDKNFTFARVGEILE